MNDLQTIAFPVRLGGHLALDFTNTVEFQHTEDAKEFLHSYQHVLAWCWQLALLPDVLAENLQHTAAADPAQAEAAFQSALALRQAIKSLFVAVTQSAEPTPEAQSIFQKAVVQAESHRSIAFVNGRPLWTWADEPSNLDRPLWPITLAAMELFTSPQLEQVRQCPNCGWLFVDTSRNHTRRWCSMEVCGSQMKSKRQYQRKLAGKV